MEKSPRTVSNSLIALVSLLGILVVTVLYVFFGVNGGFAGNIDKNYFTHVGAIVYDGDIKFSNGSNERNRVLVNAENIKIRIDNTLEGTAISATPKLGDRLLGETQGPDMYIYNARSVIVWVQTKQEKTIWENYIQKTIDSHMQYTDNRNIQPRKIIP